MGRCALAGLERCRRRTNTAPAFSQAPQQARLFFADSADYWDTLRTEQIGARTDLLALLDLLDENWVVGDLGCGAGHISEALAPCVARVISVDESGPMLAAAKTRLANHENVDLRTGTIEALPIDDGTLDAAVLFLVAHFITSPANAMREIGAFSSRAADCSSST